MGPQEKKKKKYIEIYDQICNYIRENDLKPGDKLPTEMKLCEHFGVSRTIIREAIKALEITGVITSRPGYGITICDLNAEFLMSSLINNIQMYNDDNITAYIAELRCLLELALIDETFASMDGYDIAALENCLSLMKKEGEKQLKNNTRKFGPKFAEADARFHQKLYTHTENKLIKSIIYFSWAYVQKYNATLADVSHISTTIRMHEDILSALKSRDLEKFRAAMNFHFEYDYNV